MFAVGIVLFFFGLWLFPAAGHRDPRRWRYGWGATINLVGASLICASLLTWFWRVLP